jgi:glucose-1-phosphate cytidylyltransferase
MIKDYFLKYEECVSNDFVLTEGGRKRELFSSDIHDWRITFVETGLNANIGERLLAVRRHLDGEDTFLANYADGLTDLPLPEQLAHFDRQQKVASFLCVRPNLSYHFVATEGDGVVTSFRDIAQSGLRVNGGFFVFRQEIFDYMRNGEELVLQPFHRLMEANQLVAYEYDGFWLPMDTAKDKARLDALHERGDAPWFVWRAEKGGSPVFAPDGLRTRLERRREAAV